MSAFEYHPIWNFSDSEEGLRCYVSTASGFQLHPDRAVPKPSSQHKICVLHTRQNTWEQVGVRKEFMNALCSDWDIPLQFWQQVWSPDAAAFQCHHAPNDDISNSRTRLKSVNIGFRWVAGWSGFINVVAHYNVTTSQLLLLLSESHAMAEKPLLELIQAHNRISQRPLETLGLLLSTSYNLVLADIQKCGAGLSTMELSLGVSANSKRLLEQGYSKSGRSLSAENKVLYSLQKRISANSRGCGYLAAICASYADFAATLQADFNYAIPRDDARDVARRIRVNDVFLAYQDKMVQTLFTVLYNMILREDAKVSIRIAETSKTVAEGARRDSLAMKTIAYLTLAFLPTTFVSAIFSTTVLDFQNWAPKGAERVVSGGWWVYALTCVLATAGTLGVYFFWPWNPVAFPRVRWARKQVDDVEMVQAPSRAQSVVESVVEKRVVRPLAQDVLFVDDG